ncbi:MAG: hypothetical protein LBT46_10540 [Planctomycetaceae bacterium]|nr:hypothetical protein [Planctomycetaceae bacterium]
MASGFFEAQCYSRLYAAEQKVAVTDISVSIAVLKKPKKLLQNLSQWYKMVSKEQGIDGIEGDTCPAQMIVTNELPEDENLWLGSLRGDLTVSRMDKMITAGEKRHAVPQMRVYRHVILPDPSSKFFIFQEIQDMRRKTFDEAMEEAGVAAKWKLLGEERGTIREKANAVITVSRTRFPPSPKH